MLWQPMHIATFIAPAPASPGLASCAAAGMAQLPAAASTSVETSVLFMGAARNSIKPLIIGAPLYWSALADTPAHEVPRFANLRRHARPDAGRERGGDAASPAACLLY